MEGLVHARLGASRQITLGELNALSFPARLRNGVARLFAPYL
jgi:hypothetical protein